MVVRLNPALNLRGQKLAAKRIASAELWKRGKIRSFLLDPCQQGIAKEFDESKSMKHIILCSRRLGKSYTLCTLAVEQALAAKNQYIKYLTATARDTREIVLPLMSKIFATCPNSLRPVYNKHESKYVFKNGSEILLHGVDKDGGESLRGQSADLAIIDEAGFVSGQLDYLVSDILMPMLVERDGRMLLSSTPPRDAQHPFVSMVADAEMRGNLTKRIIYDCPRFTQKQIDTFKEEAGGEDTETFQREYLCKIIRVDEISIVPEFDERAEKEITYNKLEIRYDPDCYVSLDPGYADNAAILFGYWDFLNARLVIQREFVASGQTTEQLANVIKRYEKDLWGSKQPYKRISDTDLRLIQDLRTLHELKFKKTEKDMKEAQINALRIMVKNRQLLIHESCENLILQLKYGQFKTSSSGRRDFKRTAKLGHCDAIDALLYLIRNINRTRNPIPQQTIDPSLQFDYWASAESSSIVNKIKKIFT